MGAHDLISFAADLQPVAYFTTHKSLQELIFFDCNTLNLGENAVIFFKFSQHFAIVADLLLRKRQNNFDGNVYDEIFLSSPEKKVCYILIICA